MKSLTSALMILALTATGCSKESVPGGPGATTTKSPNGTATNPSPSTTNGDAEDNTFTLKVPSTATNIDQGSDDEVTVSIDRGSKFEQKVTITFEPAAGLTLTPGKGDLDRGQNDMKVKITASPTMAVGPADVKVTATPATGKAVSETFSVDVKDASKTN